MPAPITRFPQGKKIDSEFTGKSVINVEIRSRGDSPSPHLIQMYVEQVLGHGGLSRMNHVDDDRADS